MIERTSLRATLSLTTAAAALLALSATTTLFLLTSFMERASAIIGASVESVRLLHEAEVELLLHARASDELVRRQLADELTWRLDAAGRHVATSEEGAALERTRAAIGEYLRAAHVGSSAAPALQVRAFDALKTVVDINMAQAREAELRTARWDRIANAVALGIGVSIVILAAALIWWLRRSAFRPVLALAGVMERFGGGDRGARALEHGPAELRAMSHHFNAMAERITAQQQRQVVFLSGVAHDLRNPLSALSLSLAGFSEDGPLPPEPRLRRVLAAVKRQVARMDRMIGDFLDTARIEAGELDLRLEVRELASLVRHTAALFEGTSERHPVVVSVDESLRARVDAVRIEQVIGNLISNAIRYSPDGGEVKLTLERSGAEIALRVTDHGVGIAEADRDRLFAPFQRVGPLKDHVAGIGLGLFVARRIVQAHGGRIAVASAVGHGTTFSVYLPEDHAHSSAVAFAHQLGEDLPAHSHATNE